MMSFYPHRTTLQSKQPAGEGSTERLNEQPKATSGGIGVKSGFVQVLFPLGPVWLGHPLLCVFTFHTTLCTNEHKNLVKS